MSKELMEIGLRFAAMEIARERRIDAALKKAYPDFVPDGSGVLVDLKTGRVTNIPPREA